MQYTTSGDSARRAVFAASCSAPAGDPSAANRAAGPKHAPQAVRDEHTPRSFAPWVGRERPVSRSQAYRLMSAAEAFAPLVKENANPLAIEPCAFYLLSQPEVSDAARLLAVELSNRQTVTAAD